MTGLDVRLGRGGADPSGAWLAVTDHIGGRHRELRVDAPGGGSLHGTTWRHGLPWFLDAPPTTLYEEVSGDGTASNGHYAEVWLLGSDVGRARVLVLTRDADDAVSEETLTLDMGKP